MVQPRIYVQAPPHTPLPFGLFSAATVLDDTDPHFALGGVQYEPAECGPVFATGPACTPDQNDLETTEGIGLVTGDPFVVYTLFTCKAPGSWDRGAERAREALTLGEQRGVEAGLALQLPGMEGAVDLTPTAGPVHPVDGLALLEGYSAQFYGGTPVIHAGRDLGTILTTVGGVDRQGVQLQTKQGVPVASGGGYVGLQGPRSDPADPDTAQDAADGTAWMYVTGQVVVRRDQVVEVAPTMALSPATNDYSALAERTYVVTTECIVAAVNVTSPFGIPGGLSSGGGGGVDGGGA